ncbi:MAG: O-methyltransferase, family 3 [Chthonomonadaceae bacterium]|nr:O-methyltransferase, family 3 [Chthonomonadaceae bacterium]
MSARTLTMTEPLYDYLLTVNRPVPDIFARLRAETLQLPNAMMQISVEQGRFMELLTQLIGAKKVLEVGVFTGYSALTVATALPEDGKLIACDVSTEWTSIGRKYWEEAGVAHKIDLRIAPATETLDNLLAEGQAGTFDFAFIDADKPNYDAYYERILQLLRPQGLIAIDNTLWSGKVADEAVQDESTVALRTLNAKLCGDPRVTLSVLPVGDGLTLAMKRA